MADPRETGSRPIAGVNSAEFNQATLLCSARKEGANVFKNCTEHHQFVQTRVVKDNAQPTKPRELIHRACKASKMNIALCRVLTKLEISNGFVVQVVDYAVLFF